MRTVAEIQKEIKLNGHEMTADQIEALEIEMIQAENVECGVEEVKEEVKINEKAYYFVKVTRIDTLRKAEFVLDKIIDTAKTKKTLLNKYFNGKDSYNDIDNTDDGKTRTTTYEKVMTGKRLMILGMAN
ncbi:hypothetical protein [Priestia megaterium]|uniref:hypothetical protein n=1 Tax=Priestia megaterium TaxID=1404 RepID=UPI002E229A2F|nr:hypothetical protein [Priestia megaterium]MED4102180.1 hypothetical protein [Priestia megaterium]MED4142607.1 hypothetical protein [Priestia megaterium]